MCVQTTQPGTAYYNNSYYIRYIPENSNIVNQITNTGTVTYTQTPFVTDFFRIYNTAGNALAMDNQYLTLNGVAGTLAYLIQTQTAYILDFSNCTFFTRISDRVGQFTKSGKYKFDFHVNMQSTNTTVLFYFSNTQTSGYTSTYQCTSMNGSSPVMNSFSGIIDINAGQFMMLAVIAGGAQTFPLRVNFIVERIQESQTIVNTVQNNNYINPPTTQQSYLSISRIFNGGGTLSFISTTGYLCITSLLLPSINILQQGNISLTQSPNLSTTSYFSVSKSAKYKISSYYSVYTSASYNNQFSLWDITQGISLIWSQNTSNTGQQAMQTIFGIVDLVQGRNYTIDFGNGTTFAGTSI